MKRILAILLVCVTLAGVFTSCGSNAVYVADGIDPIESDTVENVSYNYNTADDNYWQIGVGTDFTVTGEIDLNLDNTGSNMPYNITVNFGEDSRTTMMFSWHVDYSASTQVLQVTEAYNVGFNEYTEYVPTVTGWSLNDVDGNLAYDTRNICRVVVADLEPNTEYMYRVGSPDGGWSASRYFKTSGSDSFTFTVISDPQSSLDSTAYVDSAKAVEAAGKNDFLLICGDISDLAGIEQHYFNFFEKFSTFNTMPFVTISGNHETLNYTNIASSYSEMPGEARAYNAHFYNPQNGPTFSSSFTGAVNNTAAGENAVNSTYYFYYNRTLFIMVNTQQENSNLRKTVEWIDDVLEYDRANCLSDMTVAVMHKGIYGNRYYGTTYSIHEIFYDVFEKYDVDLVMSGHDHSYSVTAPKDNALTTDDETIGTVYSIVGSPGPKLYQPQVDSGWQWDYLFDLSGTATGTAAIGVYSEITIDDLGLHCTAYTVNGDELYSYFIPKKRNNGVAYTSVDKPVISVNALSDSVELSVSGNLNNVAEFSIESLGQVVGTIGRGESGCTIYGLTPASVKSLYVRIVYNDGKSLIQKLPVNTETYLNYSSNKISLDASAYDICDEYIVYVNGNMVGRLLNGNTCNLISESGDVITAELIKDGITVCYDYIIIP